MTKILKCDRLDSNGGQRWLFFCPGCHSGHAFITGGGRGWEFDGNRDCPTVSPSVRVFYPADDGEPEETLCHLFIKAGQVEFLSDCKHDLAGQTVALPDWPSHYGHGGAS